MMKTLIQKFYDALVELHADENLKMRWVFEDLCILMRGSSHPMAYSRKI